MLYIAAPFFSPEQLAVVELIEKTCKDLEVPFCSPRLRSSQKNVTRDAKEIFDRNVADISQADVLLAVLDYSLPRGHALHVVASEERSGGRELVTKSPELFLPDTGVVWEMGLAFGLSKRVAIFTQFPTGQRRLNVMLLCPAEGIIVGECQLHVWLLNGFDKEFLSEWAGGVT